MRAKALLIILISLCFGKITFAQKKDDVRQRVVEQRIEILSENLEEESDADLTQIFDDLIFFFDHPLNLNNATREI